MTSTSLHNKNMGVWAVNGPSVDGVPPFSWSEWMKTHEAVQHIGHPDVFNFDYVYMDIAQFCVCCKSECNSHGVIPLHVQTPLFDF